MRLRFLSRKKLEKATCGLHLGVAAGTPVRGFHVNAPAGDLPVLVDVRGCPSLLVRKPPLGGGKGEER